MLSDTLLLDITPHARVVVLTGEGISADSGVPPGCGADGEWRGQCAEQLATPMAFYRDPELVWQWYDMRRTLLKDCRPNPAHQALVRLAQVFKHTTVITQNVDGLHHNAGSEELLELQGNLFRMRCMRDGAKKENRQIPLDPLPPRCECGELQRPDVVWFGEPLDSALIRKAMARARSAELFLMVGTSALVEPAASLPYLALDSGATVIEIDTKRSRVSEKTKQFIEGRAAERLPALVDALLARVS